MKLKKIYLFFFLLFIFSNSLFFFFNFLNKKNQNLNLDSFSVIEKKSNLNQVNLEKELFKFYQINKVSFSESVEIIYEENVLYNEKLFSSFLNRLNFPKDSLIKKIDFSFYKLLSEFFIVVFKKSIPSYQINGWTKVVFPEAKMEKHFLIPYYFNFQTNSAFSEENNFFIDKETHRILSNDQLREHETNPLNLNYNKYCFNGEFEIKNNVRVNDEKIYLEKWKGNKVSFSNFCNQNIFDIEIINTENNQEVYSLIMENNAIESNFQIQKNKLILNIVNFSDKNVKINWDKEEIERIKLCRVNRDFYQNKNICFYVGKNETIDINSYAGLWSIKQVLYNEDNENNFIIPQYFLEINLNVKNNNFRFNVKNFFQTKKGKLFKNYLDKYALKNEKKLSNEEKVLFYSQFNYKLKDSYNKLYLDFDSNPLESNINDQKEIIIIIKDYSNNFFLFFFLVLILIIIFIIFFFKRKKSYDLIYK